MPSRLFSSVELSPRDPILGLTEAFVADSRSEKVNLGVGVYYDDNGKLPLLRCIREAEERRAAAAPSRAYQPIEGPSSYNQAVQHLLFGQESAAVQEGRVITIETLGGTGALKVGADYLRRLLPKARLCISDPSWENHRGIFEMAGFEVSPYRYYDASTRGLNFKGMLEDLEALPAQSIVVLHACCHNPTGVDLSSKQWDSVVSTLQSRDLIPFLDMAYQGFGDGLHEDAEALRKLVDSGLPLLVSSSFSKSFSLYGERVGALSVVTASADEASRVLSQIKRTIRTNYSNPPTHGGACVAMVLSTPELRSEWEAELASMRDRIKAMRAGLVAGLKAEGAKQDFSFVTAQRGMFSYTGLSVAQVDRLREEFAIYAIGTGRVCIAALNTHNLPRVCRAIATVL